MTGAAMPSSSPREQSRRARPEIASVATWSSSPREQSRRARPGIPSAAIMSQRGRRNHERRTRSVDGTHRANARRLQQEQDVIGAGLGWGQCPAPLEACPVRGASDTDDFECVDLWSDLDSCGGCAAEDSAYDCNTIPNARGVECISGYCVVHSCMAGYTVALTGDGCVPRRSEKRLL
ncbi:hypothetical protein BC827DRAFT_1356695 [Russula dissimulans]|nr:hypothetical protein BC827DRAFT_1356695 [Russula dissimulans]